MVAELGADLERGAALVAAVRSRRAVVLEVCAHASARREALVTQRALVRQQPCNRAEEHL